MNARKGFLDPLHPCVSGVQMNHAHYILNTAACLYKRCTFLRACVLVAFFAIRFVVKPLPDEN